MKRWMICLLILSMLLVFSGCGEDPTTATKAPAEDKVSIYVSETMTMVNPNGTERATVTYTFQEGWEEMAEFVITLTSDSELLEGTITMTVGDRYTKMATEETINTEIFYNEAGCAVKTVNYYASGGRRESVCTYDAQGRLLSEEERTYESSMQESAATNRVFTITETETGSKGVCTIDGLTFEMEYDLQHRLVVSRTLRGEQERQRTENTYDDAGNILHTVTYVNGKAMTESSYTYRLVEVSREVADRLPQFKRKN